MQEPQTIKIGEPYHVPQFSGVKRRLIERYDTFQYVPLLQSLYTLLGDSTVISQIEQSFLRARTDGFLNDFCDGERFRNHPLFSQDHKALQIIAFYDELEVCNPLGSHVKKHKVGIILFTLGNIDPKFRSTLRVIHLIAIATAPIIQKYGIDAIMEPFIQDLSTLATEGIVVPVNGVETTFRGALLAFVADNLASHALGGFKESFSFAVRICRSCNVTKDSYKKISSASECVPRSDSQHEQQCELLKSPAGSHYSKTYGINRRSSLMDIPYFSLFDGGLPHDFMHDVLEGVAQVEMALLIHRYTISLKYFTLQEFNDALQSFDYEYTESDKPPLTRRNFSKEPKLHMTASQSLLLIRILPLLIAHKVPEDDNLWKCFLLLLKIVDILTCPVSSLDICGFLRVLICEHHQQFIDCYSEEAMIPKFHYLLHYPDQITQVGPMQRTWCMRYEAKLNVFKRASRLGNFKNIALSLASRHQRLLCYELASDKLLETPLECGPSSPPVLVGSESHSVQQSLRLLIFDLSDETYISRPNWIKKNGLTFKRSNCYVIIGSDGLYPIFGRVDDILTVLHSNICIVLVTHCNVDYYDDHYHAYVINVSPDKSYVSVDTLPDLCILHSHKRVGCMYIYLKHYFQI